MGEGDVTPLLLFISIQVAPTQDHGWREQRAPQVVEPMKQQASGGGGWVGGQAASREF